jgi:phosphatidylglycerophosphate synthase
MNKEKFFSIFGEKDEKAFVQLRKFKDRFYSPFTKFCIDRRISPASVSYLGLLMVIPFVVVFYFNPWIALIFLLLNLFLDGLDGAIARKRLIQSIKGAIIDVTCDYAGFFAVFLTFLYFGLMNHFWGAFYAINYVALLFLIIIARSLRVKIFSIIWRSKYFIYLVYLIWLITGINYFDPVLVFFSIYMVITNYFLIKRIVCSM